MSRRFKGSVKVDESNLNHHIWRNGRYWWIHFMVQYDDGTSERIRKSLRVDDVESAREKRDKILEKLMKYKWEVK